MRSHGIQYKWDLSIKDVESREVSSLEDARKIFKDYLK